MQIPRCHPALLKVSVLFGESATQCPSWVVMVVHARAAA